MIGKFHAMMIIVIWQPVSEQNALFYINVLLFYKLHKCISVDVCMCTHTHHMQAYKFTCNFIHSLLNYFQETKPKKKRKKDSYLDYLKYLLLFHLVCRHWKKNIIFWLDVPITFSGWQVWNCQANPLVTEKIYGSFSKLEMWIVLSLLYNLW